MSEKETKNNEELYQIHADLCQMLSNPTRLKILEKLKDEEKTVSELVSEIGVRQANLSQHLAELRKRNLVKNRREGANIYYSVAHPKIVKACNLIREVVFEQLSENQKLIENR
ncbi:hypothetical protein AKJ50_00015 [candidate division MSBL1 archaeon SCGC-AAA382A13]|uniref:HTH arsR-type domain-containing protein n=1 Tax=candidate division MSBL1 archaeon SCGC-AAA382A13 TaxID=1698279 RepID=A0A133VGZ6_9EURY|nr:hypothetical protein AKJ50_00015 [candidate division MSBL1 archaeon SCGC-AAA382A13]